MKPAATPPEISDGPSPDGGGAPDSSLRNTGFAFAGLAASAGFTAILTLFLVRALGPGGYGLFGLAGAIAALVLLPSDFGLSQSTARFIADARDDPAAVTRILATALRVKVMVTGTVVVALFLGAGLIAAAFAEPGLTWVLRGFAIAILAESLMLLLTYAFVAQGRASRNITITLIEGSAEALFSIGLVLLGAGATGAAFGRAAGYLIGLVWALVLTVRTLGRTVLRRSGYQASLVGRLVRYGGAVVIVDSAYTIFTAIDALVIGWVLTASSVGLFTAPVRIVALLQIPAAAISTGVSPRMAAGFASFRDRRTFTRALSYVVLFQFALVPPMLVWAKPICDVLLGEHYATSINVLRALTPFAFLLGFGGMLSVTANYLGLARQRIPIALATVVVNAVVDLVLVPRVGIVGGAIGTDVAYAVYVPAHYWICHESVDIAVRPLAVTFLRAAAAAAMMTAVLAAVGTTGLSLLQLFVGGGLALSAYVLVLWVTARLAKRDESDSWLMGL
jgi:O-antigen/teichoic acid export membrane protein